MENGQITPEEGETMSRMLESRARVIEMRDLEARIEKLEAHDREPGRRRHEDARQRGSHLLWVAGERSWTGAARKLPPKGESPWTSHYRTRSRVCAG